MKQYVQDVAVDNAVKARIEKSWNSTIMGGESGTPMTSTIWAHLAPAEQERIEKFTHHLVTRLIKEDALPEPEDDWQECTIDQIRKGDRVRWQVPDIEDICIYEIVASHTKRADPGWFLFSDHECYHFPPGAVVDRIPAPHPDPAEHQYILVHEFKQDVPFWVMPVLGYANDEQTGYYIHGLFHHATEIIEWQHLTPAKVVEDDR